MSNSFAHRIRWVSRELIVKSLGKSMGIYNVFMKYNGTYTLWLVNIAMENGPFIDDVPIDDVPIK